MRFKKTTLCILLLGLGLSAHAQQATTTTGGDFTGSGGSVAFSVGLVVYAVDTSKIVQLSVGVQQPYEIYTVGIEEPKNSVTLTIYPNPTTDYLTLQIKDFNSQELSYEMMDAQGKSLSTSLITNAQTKIDLCNLPMGVYLINIIQNNSVQSYKIIKN